ncbi:hypothetical protein WJX84_010175 [Apatococcus fuscideae]|uniref:Uncharacterized protein n=1 Tax=Apatococcus fuscideae TaxID=2026836 RepID=A0AAW1T275_9CHLO
MRRKERRARTVSSKAFRFASAHMAAPIDSIEAAWVSHVESRLALVESDGDQLRGEVDRLREELRLERSLRLGWGGDYLRFSDGYVLGWSVAVDGSVKTSMKMTMKGEGEAPLDAAHLDAWVFPAAKNVCVRFCKPVPRNPPGSLMGTGTGVALDFRIGETGSIVTVRQMLECSPSLLPCLSDHCNIIFFKGFVPTADPDVMRMKLATIG